MASFPEPQELHHWTATRPSGRGYIATSTSTTMDPHTPQQQQQQQQQHLQHQFQPNSHSQSFLQPTPTPSNLQQQYQNQTPSHSFSNPPYTNSFVPTPPESVHRTTVANTAANAASASSHNFDSALGVSQSQSQQLLQPGRFIEEWDATQRGSSLLDAQRNSDIMQRSNSVNSYNAGDDMHLPIRGNTLKKKNSLRRNGSLKRSSSRRSMRAGSVKSLALQSISDPDEGHSAFHCPVPTSGSPTDILANRFQSWRKILKDLIAYFREIQSHYEQRSKSLLKLANVSNNISTPPGFLVSAGIDDALQFIRSYNKAAILEANKAKEIEEDVVLALTGLRSDLQQKIKEIKNLSGDFKNTVEKEMDHTRKAVRGLGDVLGRNEMDESLTTGKSDPYLLRLAVDRQLERQLDEENYLHQAYLNLESSGRELESIVVGEIQKAYNAYAGILKREADNSYNLVAELRDGPVSMPKDQEWMHFVTHDSQFVDPNIPLRTPDQIHYPGQDHEAAQEIRAGLLERKSKYLKSYTAGWYVLSSTHLHEFKSADKVQAPVMSLYLPEQKLGSHSSEGGSSNKFIVKGRQTGSMHRGHTWVFRAESHDTMMAWYEDIKALTEKTPEERSQFVRSHSRSLSRSSRRSTNSDELLDDEDEEPFTAEPQVYTNAGPKDPDQTSRRSQAGGRFPSDIQVNAQRGLQAPHSPSSVSSGFQDHRTQPGALVTSGALPVSVLAAGTLGNPGNQESHSGYGNPDKSPSQDLPVSASFAGQHVPYDAGNSYTTEPLQQNTTVNQYQTGGDYFVPIVVPQKRGGSSPGAIANDEHQESASSTNPAGEHRRDYGVLDEFEPTTSDYPSGGKQPNGGTSADANVMILDAEGFPKLDPITRMDHADVPDVESPLTSIGDSTIDEPAPVRPSNNNTRNESAQTISSLHIPGQYPKGAFV